MVCFTVICLHVDTQQLKARWCVCSARSSAEAKETDPSRNAAGRDSSERGASPSGQKLSLSHSGNPPPPPWSVWAAMGQSAQSHSCGALLLDFCAGNDFSSRKKAFVYCVLQTRRCKSKLTQIFSFFNTFVT